MKNLMPVVFRLIKMLFGARGSTPSIHDIELLNPPSNNAELQKIIIIIAKHMHDCYEIRKNVIKS